MSIVEEGIARADTLTPSEFALEVSRAVAVSGNGHTTALPFRFFRYLPVRVWWFSDGLYVVESDPDYSDLLGARVEAIGEFTAEQSLARLSPFISGTPEHQRSLSPSFLTSLEALHHAGISDKPTEASFTLRMRGGETVVVRLGQQQSDGPGGQILIPSALNRPGRWSHVLDASRDLPPAFRPPRVDLSYEFLRDGSVLYIRSDQILSTDTTSLHDKLIAMLHEAFNLGPAPKFAVVDLRLNGGGNLFNTVVFSQVLPALVPDDGKIFVLVGNATFSAALVTAAMLKGNGGDKVVFVGERMGDSSRF